MPCGQWRMNAGQTLRCAFQPQNDAGGPKQVSGTASAASAQHVGAYAATRMGGQRQADATPAAAVLRATDFSKAHTANSPELAGPGLCLLDLASGVAWPALPRCALFLSVHTAPAASICSLLQ